MPAAAQELAPLDGEPFAATTPTTESASSSPSAHHRHHNHKVRRLKLYSVEEKLDIIDYAKIIGNRAAGREFNVAESSIREWRKNEDKLRWVVE